MIDCSNYHALPPFQRQMTRHSSGNFLVTRVTQIGPANLEFSVHATPHNDISELVSRIQQAKLKRLMLVASEETFNLSGFAEQWKLAWHDGANSIPEQILFDDFSPNPKVEDAVGGVALARQHSVDGILAIGGGSAMDMAKLIAVGSTHQSPLAEIIPRQQELLDRSWQRTTWFGLVPTTAGTGSEATQFAVAYLAGKKYSLSHPGLLPDEVLLSPNLLNSLPTSMMAASGLDAICQAMESMWSLRSTSESLGYSRRSLKLGLQHLIAAVTTPNEESRRGMQQAAYLAGQAINITRTTAPHALSYHLTSEYGVPHGFAVALTMPAFLSYNAQASAQDCLDPRGTAYVRDICRELGDALQEITGLPNDAGSHGPDRFRALMQAVSAPLRLGDIGLHTDDQYQAHANSVNLERLANNPRQIDTATIKTLLAEQVG